MTLFSEGNFDKFAGNIEAMACFEKILELDDIATLFNDLANKKDFTQDPTDYENIRAYIVDHRDRYRERVSSETDEQKKAELSGNLEVSNIINVSENGFPNPKRIPRLFRRNGKKKK